MVDRNYVDGSAFESDVTTVPNGVADKRAKTKTEKARQPQYVEQCCNDNSFVFVNADYEIVPIDDNIRMFKCTHCGTIYKLDIYPDAYEG